MSTSALRQKVNSYFEALASKDVDRISKFLSDDLKYYRHPRPAEATWDKAEYLAHLSLLDFYLHWKPELNNPISIVENEKERHFVVLHSAEALAKNGKTYNPDYVWFFHFDEEGKIDLLREYVDTVYVETIQADYKAYHESKAT